MKVRVDGQEYDVDLQGVADILLVCGAGIAGKEVPDFVDQQKQVSATSFIFAAILLLHKDAESLLKSLVGDINEFVGESGGLDKAAIRLEHMPKRSGS